MKRLVIPVLLTRLLAALGLAVGLGLGLVACGNMQTETPASQQGAQKAQPTVVVSPPAPQPDVSTRPAPSRDDRAKQEQPKPVASPAEARREQMADKRIAAAPVAAGMPSPYSTVMQQPVAEERERYGQINDNPVHLVAESPVSTFSIDVDTGSYSNMRRFLNQGRLPPADALRVEELINYFPYDYAQPTDGRPFAVHTELAPAPWNAQKLLLAIGIKGKDVAKQSLPAANLVFLVDVSGSMNSPDKLPLLKSSLKLLVNEMRAQDRISLVTYADGTGIVLPPTAGTDKATINAAIDALRAGGSTAGASGIQLAYSAAQQSFIKGGINRILLATDGDFNVGISDTRQLKSLIEEKRKSGISLSTLGFGTGNYNEAMMEQIADVGDGAYSYIDNLMEGHKVLVNEMTSTLATIAQDVKVQVEFNPATVQEYRLVGYENRILKREDFNNDKVDAGDIGAGHTVTALYEITLKGAPGLIDPLRYGVTAGASLETAKLGNELAHVKLRYKLPGESGSTLIDRVVSQDAQRDMAQASNEFRFATAVAGFGQLMRGGKYTGNWKFADARALAAASVGKDRFGYRGEFLRLVDLASSLSTRPMARKED
ncbi:vWA domain-containing protein [Viridibacterium curvum]|uniref:VWA domain-containing protein n=1 Tax=Viridibacterium curvum TaxID=1101404 RepID=A0ABP9QT27_9RHOO